MADTKPIIVKLMVDKSSNRVLFAESGSDFVDVLLSFLTLPIGCIVQLFKKQSSMGCMDKLYESVEHLDDFLMDRACRTMLLFPKNSSATECKSLKVNIDNTYENVKFYTCSSVQCSCERHKLLSFYEKSECLCGRIMDKVLKPLASTTEGVFVKGKPFAIYDDLVFAVIEDTLQKFYKLAISDWSNLEERIVKIGHDEVLYLLKRSLISMTPLTDVFLQPKSETKQLELTPTHHNASSEAPEIAVIITVKINLKLVFAKRNKVLYAEANQDYIDLLFSFLTFPLGSFPRHMGGQSSIICLDNLYKSADNLRLVDSLVKENEEALLNPKISTPILGCKNRSIAMVEETKLEYYRSNHHSCDHISTRKDAFCDISKTKLKFALKEMHLPCDQNMVDLGSRGGYCKPFLYMVTDELAVTPLSLFWVTSLCKGFEGQLEQTEISLKKRDSGLAKGLLDFEDYSTDGCIIAWHNEACQLILAQDAIGDISLQLEQIRWQC